MPQEELVATCRAMDKLNADELIKANKYLRERLSHLRAMASMAVKYHFKENDTVEFPTKWGMKGKGTVVKINRTTATLQCSDGRWRVPLSMLKKVEAVQA